MIKYKIGDVARIISERVDNPANCEYKKFVGLEHYVSGEIEINRYGDTSLLKSAMKIFKSGDVLIARRNVYLKRASIVRFDGITSGDSIVLRIENDLIRQILPFILNTDEFWEYAEKFSDGTMSKRLSPKVLLEYEFSLPEVEKQEKLAELLWAANNAKEAYKKLIYHTDELVESQFIEMFGSERDNFNDWPIKKWDDVLHIRNGRAHKEVNDPNGKYPIYGSGGKLGMANDFLSPEYTIVLGRKGTIDKPFISEEKCWIVDTSFGLEVNANILHYRFFHQWCKLFNFLSLNRAAVLPSLTKGDLLKIEMIVPPLVDQKKFVVFVEQTDQSKLALQENIYSLEKTIKAVMSKNFG